MDRNTPSLPTKEVSQSAAPATTVLPADPSRRLLQIANTGGASLKFRFGAAPDANNGMSLAAGATVTYDVRVPTGDLYVTAGASVYIIFG